MSALDNAKHKVKTIKQFLLYFEKDDGLCFAGLSSSCSLVRSVKIFLGMGRPSQKESKAKGLQPSDTPAGGGKPPTPPTVQCCALRNSLRFIAKRCKKYFMGIPTGDNDVVFGNDCLNRFAAGETPKFITVRYTGMQQGDDWIPADGAPQNIEASLQQNAINACLFLAVDGLNEFFLFFTATSIQIAINFDVFGNVFFGEVFSTTAITVQNNLNNPVGTHFFGGEAAIAILPGVDLQEIHGVQDALNMEHSSNTFASVFPVNTDKAVFRIGRRSDGTNISIKTEE